MKFTNFLRNSKLFVTCSGLVGTLFMYNEFHNKRMKLKEKQRLVYSWGNGIAGQLGIGVETSSQASPKLIKELVSSDVQIEKLVAAFDISCGITSKGDVYVWGKTKDGALGIFPGGTVNLVTPSLLVHSNEIDSKPLEVDFSKEHGVLVTTNGSLYTWGVDMHSKLGHTKLHDEKVNQKLRRVPKNTYELVKFAKVNLPQGETIISAKCGYNHTVCLNANGEVYSWGFPKDGALGHGDFNSVDQPKKISYFIENKIKIKKIECGDYFSLALSEEGIIYAWGHNNYGQLGVGGISQRLKINSPVKINLQDKRIKDIFTGEDHCACVTENGEGFIWGYGIDGRLGTGNKMNTSVPTKITVDNSKIKKISCGGHHTAILTESGDLYMCGNGRDGELGRGDLLESQSVMRYEPLLVTQFRQNDEKVIDVACGSSHTIALVEK